MREDEEIPIETATLPLDAWHRAKGGRMVEFAGYWMPIQYEGIMAEHLWTRENAGLFDVSHMGQLSLSGDGVAEALETLVPGDISALKPGRMRYSLLLDEDGGILDDLMITNEGDQYGIVVNGAVKWEDIGHLRENLPDHITLNHNEDYGLLALQGPKAVDALSRLIPEAATLVFMQATRATWQGHAIGLSRSGYTGEDGFEISLPNEALEAFADALCAMEEVKPIGLGARDSLRLEAGLPLYGHDLSPEIDPAEADLGFAVSKRRREEENFPGAARILGHLEDGPPRKRVGLTVDGKLPVREGAKLFDGEDEIGVVTSGGFAPSVGAPIAMGFVPTGLSEPGAAIAAEVRGKLVHCTVTAMPFIPHRYVRKQGA
ncbi:glycine cleavage system aminomethyltransferase GcvT [Sphingopyxis sp. SE2]|jgi:aminomethyltransferase|uniref:glycine cleavage system aminomethyltransferase GcvT n=1 Tax=Sphingopyxis sp. SE2 TaxID=1586240 RepID=UPI0028C143F3|nr:glycine cleavage system aminomethyltransferase GcvT [Sphingopyxis sp. SE2]MDT7527395.1 glycine cleavage system aminomethyltransferase GcvT [Sphingopyxis sp. SE2]